MQGKINLDLSSCLADNGFSLDELVVKLGELFENRGYSEVLKLILLKDITLNEKHSPLLSVSCFLFIINVLFVKKVNDNMIFQIEAFYNGFLKNREHLRSK